MVRLGESLPQQVGARNVSSSFPVSRDTCPPRDVRLPYKKCWFYRLYVESTDQGEARPKCSAPRDTPQREATRVTLCRGNADDVRRRPTRSVLYLNRS